MRNTLVRRAKAGSVLPCIISYSSRFLREKKRERELNRQTDIDKYLGSTGTISYSGMFLIEKDQQTDR